MTLEQADQLIEILGNLHAFTVNSNYVVIGLLCALIFAVSWKA